MFVHAAWVRGLACSGKNYKLKGPFFGLPDIPPLFKSPRYEHLSVSDDEFDEIANALRTFWVEFPERMYLSETASDG